MGKLRPEIRGNPVCHGSRVFPEERGTITMDLSVLTPPQKLSTVATFCQMGYGCIGGQHESIQDSGLKMQNTFFSNVNTGISHLLHLHGPGKWQTRAIRAAGGGTKSTCCVRPGVSIHKVLQKDERRVHRHLFSQQKSGTSSIKNTLGGVTQMFCPKRS